MLPAISFPIFENNKKWKEGKIPKRNIKGLWKEKIKKNKNGPQKKKEIKIRHESEEVKMPLCFYCKNNDYVQIVENDIIHDQLSSLILTFHAFNFMF